MAIRIGELEDSTLRARKLTDTTKRMIAAPSYFERFGRPQKIDDLNALHRTFLMVRPPRTRRSARVEQHGVVPLAKGRKHLTRHVSGSARHDYLFLGQCG